ncbi:hypothetical protein BH10CYA1_BH10CYA1_44120 [soil metagenome]
MPVALQIVALVAIDFGFVFLDQWLFTTYHHIFKLGLWFQLATSVWAAWDSAKLGIKRYRTVFSLHPLLVFVFCALLWIVGMPLYLVARNKVVKGKAALKSDTPANPKRFAYLAKMVGFTTACLGLGGIVLFCIFAPRINPGFLNDSIFQDPSEAGSYTGGRVSQGERSYFQPIVEHLTTEFTAEDFNKLGISTPENVEFKTKDGITLKGWFFSTADATKTVLFSGDGLFGMRFPVQLGYIKLLQKAKYSVLIYDYRKFSQPGTKSDTENSLIDGRAAFDYLIKERKIIPAQLILMGRGIGASICCQISKTAQCAGLILEDPWTDLKAHVDQSSALAMKLIPRSMYPGDGLDNTVILKAAHSPVLIAASNPKDSGGYDVFEQTAAPKQFVKLRAFDSIRLPDLRLDADKYTEKLTAFLVAPQAPPEKSVESRIGDLEKRLQARQEMQWQTDIETSLTKAREMKKMVLVDVYATWCGPCKKMDAQTYSDPRVLNLIKENFVAVKVDADDDQGQAFSKKHNIYLLPTLIILDADGKIIDRMSGFASAKELLRELKAL